MKSYKELAKEYSPKEIAESFVFPSELSKKRREESLESFRKFRREAESKRSPKHKLISQLLQLRFLMEDYLKADSYNTSYSFAYFLKEYIARQEKKNKEFAEEIDIDPTELSQIINRHRPPSEKFIIRLEIHSNKNFPAIMWFKVIEMEKAFELVHDQELRDVEYKHVKRKLEFSLKTEDKMSNKKIYVERREEGDYAVRKAGSERASAVKSTQKKAIEKARELNPGVNPHVERVRNTSKGSPDKWRKA